MTVEQKLNLVIGWIKEKDPTFKLSVETDICINSRKNAIESVLTDTMIDKTIHGYNYLKTAIELCLDDIGYFNKITTALYPEIAKKYNSTAPRVERSIRHAILKAYELCLTLNNLDTVPVFNTAISHKKGNYNVTNKEYIILAVEEVKKRYEGNYYDD